MEQARRSKGGVRDPPKAGAKGSVRAAGAVLDKGKAINNKPNKWRNDHATR
ncbi:hypothetical protein HY768_00490 [candidate division TA06 bacterium]|uniref:Uncharacterized protein n=1 Tax=candidate division TA06 bacterium TaxID=2250710 RepID=A0A933I7L2_UNCT6|nr:hypothetical protein [candidate division TA06 bacterium]